MKEGARAWGLCLLPASTVCVCLSICLPPLDMHSSRVHCSPSHMSAAVFCCYCLAAAGSCVAAAVGDVWRCRR